MATIPELPQPGVEVIQEFRTVTPSIAVPTLVPCIVGVCKEIRELYVTDSTGDSVLNSDILVSGPAIATASIDDDPEYALANTTLSLRVNGGVEQSFTFASSPATITAQEAATAINGATPAPQGFQAYVYTDALGDEYLQLRGSGTGSSSDSIQITDGDANSILGFGNQQMFYGIGTYIQDKVYLKQESFPDPRGNLAELDIDEDSIRVFLDLSTSVVEVLQTESFLRRGTTIAAVDDGDGDQLTPYVEMSGQDFKALPTSAVVDGTVDLNSNRQEINQQMLAIQLDGSGKQFVKFYGIGIISIDSTGWAWASITGSRLELSVNGVVVNIPVVAAANLADLVTEINVASQAAAGINVAYRSDADGTLNAVGLFLTLLCGAVPTIIDKDSDVQVTTNTTAGLKTEIWAALTLPIKQPLWGNHTTVNGGVLAGGPFESHDIEAQIDAVFGSTFASIDSTGVADHLKLTSPKAGNSDSKIEILANPDSTSTCLTALGLTAGVTYGNPFTARIGDYVYADGTLVGMIVQVHPGATTGRIKLDREVSTNVAVWNPGSWYIIAKNLDTFLSAQWGTVVPRPDLVIDNNGDVVVKHDFLRDTTGAPIGETSVSMYCMYDALRKDVSAVATNPALLTFDTTTQLEASLDPVSPDNPLSYGLFCAIANANGVAVSGLGVSAFSDDKPYGTLPAYTEAFEFLQTQEIYALACMTSDVDILMAAKQHVNQMSDPDMKGERIAIGYLGVPARKVDDIAVSGNNGDSVSGGPPYYFDTKIATLSQALLALGIDPTSSFGVGTGMFLDLATDAYNWNLAGPVVDGTKLKINTTFAAGEDDDYFYERNIANWTSQMPIVSASFSVNRRGAPVANKSEEIETIYFRGRGFMDRRVWMMQLDKLRATVNSVEQLVEGFYMSAAKAGQVGGLRPSQPLTNYPISVFTGVTGTRDRYNQVQLNQGAAGGADWIIQPSAGAPLVSRHQVTTDLTSVEKREQSIVKAVDFCAKFYRSGLQPYVGRYNITQSYLDTLSAVVQGFGNWLVEDGKVVMAANLNNLIQSEDVPDMVLIDVSLEVFYPGNYLRLTLVV